jgi:hydroxyacylglutathione hydrolase
MQVEGIVVTAFSENSYLVWDEESNEGIIIDPGGEADRIAGRIDEIGFTPMGIYNTHCHIDHVGAVGALKERYGIKFYIHKEDEPLLEGFLNQAMMFGLSMGKAKAPKADGYVADGDELQPAKGLTMKVIHTPGHTTGGVCFLINETDLFAGDTLFADSIGRTDLPGGSYSQIITSIKDKIMALPDNVILHAGHMHESTVGRERSSNPFVLTPHLYGRM